MDKTKLHLGCGWRDFGDDWVHIDDGDYDHLDYKSDVTKLPLEDETFDLVYASHVIAYFDKEEIKEVLNEWKRVLKPGGVLRIATPDFYEMTKLYLNGGYDLSEFIGPMYGRMSMGPSTIYHKITYDFNSLSEALHGCGFKNVHKYDWRGTEHAQFDDHSQAYKPNMDKENGTLISLNVECEK